MLHRRIGIGTRELLDVLGQQSTKAHRRARLIAGDHDKDDVVVHSGSAPWSAGRTRAGRPSPTTAVCGASSRASSDVAVKCQLASSDALDAFGEPVIVCRRRRVASGLPPIWRTRTVPGFLCTIPAHQRRQLSECGRLVLGGLQIRGLDLGQSQRLLQRQIWSPFEPAAHTLFSGSGAAAAAAAAAAS